MTLAADNDAGAVTPEQARARLEQLADAAKQALHVRRYIQERSGTKEEAETLTRFGKYWMGILEAKLELPPGALADEIGEFRS